MSNFRTQYIPEGVLIIVSILIAFAIDAWWDERQDRSQETRILEALRSEFQENADRLPTHIRIRESDAEHARVLVEESQTLRQRLVRWPMLVADAVENDHFLRSTAAPRAFDYLAERVDLGLVDQIVRCKYENSVEDCSSASFELEATSELSGIVAHIRGWSAESGAELEIVRKEALDLVQQLDEELAKR